MTKYILQSGNVKDFPEKIKKYNEEIFRDFLSGNKEEKTKSESVKVLFCIFSQPREVWETKFELYRKSVNVGVDVAVEAKLAMPDEFTEQCQWADVIIIVGGDDELLQHRMNKFDIPKIWEGRVVTASSAGSNYLVNSFFTCDWRKIMDGRGIIQIKFIPHYKSYFGDKDPRGPIDWEKAYKELKNYGDKNLPIHALEDGDFVVIEK